MTYPCALCLGTACSDSTEGTAKSSIAHNFRINMMSGASSIGCTPQGSKTVDKPQLRETPTNVNVQYVLITRFTDYLQTIPLVSPRAQTFVFQGKPAISFANVVTSRTSD